MRWACWAPGGYTLINSFFMRVCNIHGHSMLYLCEYTAKGGVSLCSISNHKDYLTEVARRFKISLKLVLVHLLSGHIGKDNVTAVSLCNTILTTFVRRNNLT